MAPAPKNRVVQENGAEDGAFHAISPLDYVWGVLYKSSSMALYGLYRDSGQ